MARGRYRTTRRRARITRPSVHMVRASAPRGAISHGVAIAGLRQTVVTLQSFQVGGLLVQAPIVFDAIDGYNVVTGQSFAIDPLAGLAYFGSAASDLDPAWTPETLVLAPGSPKPYLVPTSQLVGY